MYKGYLAQILGAMGAYSSIPGMGLHIPADKLRGIDIEEEYHLIKAKKSRLSSSMRAMVVARYERKYKTKEAGE